MGKQLSLFDIKNDSSRSSNYDLDYVLLPKNNLEVNKAPRFVSLSVLIHSALVMGALSLAPLLKPYEPVKETITIELEDLSAPMISQGVDVPASQAEKSPLPESNPQAEITAPPSTPSLAEESPVEVLKPKAVIEKPTPAKVTKANPPKAAPKVTTPAPVIAKTEASTSKPAVATPAPVSETLDDIDSPELDNLPTAVATSQPAAPAKPVEQVKAQHASIDDIDESFDSNLDTAQLDSALAQEQQSLASEQEALRQKNAAAIAAAQKSEAEGEARRRKEALLAAQAQDGQGSGQNGNPNIQTPTAGQAQGVRSLDQLKQMPRNPLPQYSADERFYGHQGTVVFQAYITHAGKPTQFKLVRSSGHQNLDSKTLAALQNWKFYPGQEGWVELPFNWSLSGEAQETGRLRRAAIDNE